MAANKFTVPLDQVAKKLGERADSFVRSVAMETFARVIMRTPVDTGRARANWVVSYGEPRERVITMTDPGGANAVTAMQKAVMSFPAIGTIWMTNSLPYIGVLEYGGYPNPPKAGTKSEGGFSKQAPAGMVRITVEEVNGIILEALQQ